MSGADAGVGIEEQLRGLEPVFHRLAPGAGRDEVEALVAEDFWEVGASGQVYKRAFVVDLVTQRYAEGADDGESTWDVADFHVMRLAADTWLATYRLDQNGRVSRRSTIWRRDGEGWKVVYHQGTLISG